MKKCFVVLIAVFVLFGCAGKNKDMDDILRLRQKMIKGNGCSFRADILADYGNKSYVFSLGCVLKQSGDIDFEILMPETVSGIKGSVSDLGGKITFDDKVLLFEPLANGQLIPAVAPWLLFKAVRGGYIRAVSAGGDNMEYTINDSFNGVEYQTLLILKNGDQPQKAEIYWNNRRILIVDVGDYKEL